MSTQDSNKKKITIMGLGEAGKNIVEDFRGYPQFDVVSIDSEGSPDILIDHESNHEKYEKDYGKLADIDGDELIFILSGSGDISGAALSILEPYNEKDITIYYIEPDRNFLSVQEKKKEKIVRNVLMQMSRSAVFDRMFFASNPKIEDILGGVPIKQYYEKINELISFTLSNYLYFQNNDSVFGNMREPDEICRLSTMGIIKEDQEQYFYPLDMIREKEFYFTFEQEELENNTNLIGELKESMKKKRDGEFQTAISYGIYEAEDNYHICVENTHVDQSLLENEEK